MERKFVSVLLAGDSAFGSLNRLQLLFGDKFKDFNPQEVQVLVTADIEGFVDNARMRQITGSHTTDITRVLQRLVAQGVLVQEGRARGSRYRLPTQNDSLHNGSDSLHNEFDLPYATSDVISQRETEEAQLLEISVLCRRKSRVEPKQVEQIIRELCRGRWLSRKRLSELLNRNAEGLLTRFLGPMVQHGLLRLRFPDKPNRVDQAYTATSINEEVVDACEDMSD